MLAYASLHEGERVVQACPIRRPLVLPVPVGVRLSYRIVCIESTVMHLSANRRDGKVALLAWRWFYVSRRESTAIFIKDLDPITCTIDVPPSAHPAESRNAPSVLAT